MIPHAGKTIEVRTFARSTKLTIVNLVEGLEDIEARAFQECTSLNEI